MDVPAKTLGATWYGVGDLRLEERPLAPLGPGDVLVEVAGCGVCATDLHLLDGSISLYRPPRVLGHEVGGTVRATGAAVRHVRPGDAVALDTSVPCGVCFYCREQRPFFCPDRASATAGFSEWVVVPGALAFPLPEGVEAAMGALAEPLSCALHAVELAGLRPADSVAILGAGAIGLLLLQLARLAGATRVLVSDPDPGRRRLAERLGATGAVDPLRDEPRSAGAELTAGRGVDCVFEAVGAEATIEQAIGLPRPGGTVVLVGVPPSSARPRLPAYELWARELTVRASFIRATEFRRAVDLLATLALAPLVSHRFPLREVHAAFEAARTRQGIRVLVGPSAR